MDNDVGNIDVSDELPPYLEVYRKQFGNDALVCPDCRKYATGGYGTVAKGYKEMECVIFQCHNHGCPNKGWAWCSTCKEKFNRPNVNSHVRTHKHRSNVGKEEVALAIVFNQTDQAAIIETRSEAMMSIATPEEDLDLTNTGSVGTYAFPDDAGSLAGLSQGAFVSGMDAAMYLVNGPQQSSSVKSRENNQEAESPKVLFSSP
jgi:hypothetical protein